MASRSKPPRRPAISTQLSLDDLPRTGVVLETGSSSRASSSRTEEPAEPSVISVAELARRLRRATERVSAGDWIEGEVAGLRQAASGHIYFTLKDEREDAVLEAVVYRFHAQRARRHLIDGARVQVRGRATLWAPRGRLQLVVEVVRPQGRGALLEALEKLKAKLAAEGLFDPQRKRSVPPSPKVIGIVTSRHGAALHDICSVGFRRANVRFVLAPALVQGDGAPRSILNALDLLEKHSEVELVIVGRGGGSAEDLMAFNDERVVRHIAAFRVPVISAVGHEIDVSLTDLAADVRAATPSQAAELAVADQWQKLEDLRAVSVALARAMRTRLVEDRSVAERLRGRIIDPRFLIADRQQYTDDLLLRLERDGRRRLGTARSQLNRLQQRLAGRHPRAVLNRSSAALTPLSGKLTAAMRLLLGRREGRLRTVAAQLDELSPLTVLSRGYSLVQLEDGTILRDAKQVTKGDALRVRVHRGVLQAKVTAKS